MVTLLNIHCLQKIHNYWFNENKIKSIYEKKELLEHELKSLVDSIKNDEISGANITVPFKQKIIPFLDRLSEVSEKTYSVNTIYKKNNIVIGDNTDIFGFVESIKYQSIDLKNKTADFGRRRSCSINN